MSNISRRLNYVSNKISQKELLEFAYDVFVDETPVRSGNARKRTVKQTGDTIFADYPYAQRLDQGWSKQARDGMTKPTIQAIRKYLRGI